MGRDKALIPSPDDPGLSLAERTAILLTAVTNPVIEVGPGRTGLPSVDETPAGGGPLVALVEGSTHLAGLGWDGPALVLATDLPYLTLGLLEWLADYPGNGSVVPTANGVPQPLCARYSQDDRLAAARLVATGSRSMRDLVDAIKPAFAGEEIWSAEAGRVDAMRDVDGPGDVTWRIGWG